MAEPFAIDGGELRVSTRIGITSFPDDSLDADGLLWRADLALYSAKTEGAGKVQHFEPPMEFARQERLALQTGLARG